METVNARTSPLWIKFQALRYDNDILFKNTFHLWRTQGKGGDREKRKKKNRMKDNLQRDMKNVHFEVKRQEYSALFAPR